MLEYAQDPHLGPEGFTKQNRVIARFSCYSTKKIVVAHENREIGLRFRSESDGCE